MSARDWVPAGSVPYETAGAADLRETTDGTVAHFSTVAYKPPKVRNPKMCVGNDGTCGGWKSAGTNFCHGHLRGQGVV